MKLIADAGSTKVEWALMSPDGAVQTFESPGLNALLLSPDELREAFARALADVDCAAIASVAYYGAGCIGPEVAAKVSTALPVAPEANVEVHSDLLGAARALYGRSSGLAAIMGTGSNTGLYDGSRITANMPPLGFILGDEGSGAALGRELLRLVYRFNLERTAFEEWLGMDYAAVLERVYRRPAANAFLASLVPFIAEHRAECREVTAEVFGLFMSRIAQFYGPSAGALRICGGLAEAFAPEIARAARAHGISVTRTLNRPMPGLIEYHSTNP